MPNHGMTNQSVAVTLSELNRLPEALPYFERAMAAAPDDAAIRGNFAQTLHRMGRVPEAIQHYEASLRLNRRNHVTWSNLGKSHMSLGQFPRAAECFQQALKISPNYTDARWSLASVLDEIARSLASHPQTERRNGAEAVRLAEEACNLTGHREPVLLDTLAAAYAEAGRFEDAVKTAEKALELATAAKMTLRLDGIRTRLALYQAGRPYHHVSPTTAPDRTPAP